MSSFGESYPHLRRALRLWPVLFPAWFVVPMLVSRIIGIREGTPTGYDLAGALLVGTITSACMAIVETRPLSRRARGKALGRDLLGRTLFYTVIVALTILLGWIVLPIAFPGEYAPDEMEDFSGFVSDHRPWLLLLGLLLSSMAINFFLHLRLVVGPKHLAALFMGKYRSPIEEARLFVFMDLIDSTAIAQALGALEFAHFKHDFFCDVTDAAADYSGEIIQYVGDEVMLSWNIPVAAKTGAPLKFLAVAVANLDRRADYFRERYGRMPRFRTGIHAGNVVVAELGDQRRDIVYSGDVVNTAARLLAACRPEGVDVLISKFALQLMPDIHRRDFEPSRALMLRGRQEALEVYAPAYVPTELTTP